MMFRLINIRLSNCKGASLIEYALFITIILAGLFVMKEMISRGIFSKYRQASDSFGFGRQYDGKRTTVCRQDVLSYNADGSANMGHFYDEDCYYTRVMRKPSLVDGAWDTRSGGCPQCDPGNTSDSKACFACEDAIKEQCAIESQYCKQ